MTRTIVHVTSGLGVGGAERMLIKLLEAHRGAGWTHRVVSLRAGGELREEVEALSGPVDEIGVRGAWAGPIAAWRLRRAVARHDPALVLGWMYHGNLAAWWSRGGAPLIWNIRHSVYDLKREKRGTALVIRAGAKLSGSASAIIYNSEVSSIQHVRLGYRADRGVVIPNGFDLSRFRRRDGAGQALRTRLAVASDEVLVGLIARVHHLKGHEFFLQAAEQAQLRVPNARFVLIGTGTEERLAQWQRARPTTLRAHALGEVRGVEEIVAGLDVAVSSSISEGFPNAIGEAMASSVPCIVTDVGDSGYLLGAPDWTVPPGDAAALAEKIVGLVVAGSAKRRELGERGHARIAERFSMEAIVARYETLFEQIARGKQ